MMKASHYKAARFDLLDNKQPPHRKSNFMNLLHGSGFACPARGYYICLLLADLYVYLSIVFKFPKVT